MNKSVKRLYYAIQNTLAILAERNLLIITNGIVPTNDKDGWYISSPNHVSSRFNSSKFFNQIDQYKHIISANSYTSLLFDGSVIKIFYAFNKEGELTSHSLLWWPSPFPIDSTDLEMGGLLDLLDMYSTGTDWHKWIQMRTPIRFDFDPIQATELHPLIHMHFQSGDCRHFIEHPICFNRFLKYIFQNCYPVEYSRYKFWNDLNEIDFRIAHLPQACQPGFAQLSWYRL